MPRLIREITVQQCHRGSRLSSDSTQSSLCSLENSETKKKPVRGRQEADTSEAAAWTPRRALSDPLTAEGLRGGTSAGLPPLIMNMEQSLKWCEPKVGEQGTLSDAWKDLAEFGSVLVICQEGGAISVTGFCHGSTLVTMKED